MQVNITEKYLNYEIEWIVLPSFSPPYYKSRDGIELYYERDMRRIIVGFVDGYKWFHKKRGRCIVYILSQDSEEWVGLFPETADKVREVKDCIYDVMREGHLHGRIKGDIYAWANA